MRREGDGQECGAKGSRPRDHQQIGIIILKVTVIIASIYLAPIKSQSLGIHLFLPKLWKVATGISAVQMRRQGSVRLDNLPKSKSTQQPRPRGCLGPWEACGHSLLLLRQVGGRLAKTGRNFNLKLMKKVQ